MALVEWLHHGRLARDVAGGKGASLSGLIAAGFPVPEGFAVTAEGYRYYLGETGLDLRIEELLSSHAALTRDATRGLAATISSLILQTKLPSELQYQIAAAYEVLATTNGIACAVRSSAIDEDGTGISMAGLYESYLNVRGPAAVQDMVKRCISTFWSEQAIAHRLAHQPSGPAAMAVVVMSLVSSEAAGVAFTAQPVTGDRELVVINASWGLGEGVVSGIVTPDSFVVRKDTLAVESREIGDKTTGFYPSTEGAGTVQRPIEPSRASQPCLTDEQAIEVARTAVAIEAAQGRPVDVEWGVAHGRLFVLQSRPITTL